MTKAVFKEHEPIVVYEESKRFQPLIIIQPIPKTIEYVFEDWNIDDAIRYIEEILACGEAPEYKVYVPRRGVKPLLEHFKGKAKLVG